MDEVDDAGGRVEHDSLGEVRVPAGARWGAQTQRAVENFPISGTPVPRSLLGALGAVKAAAARVNGRRGDVVGLDPDMAEAIASAASRVASGDLDDQFPVDAFQTGSGTSTNMNANEVIANLASEQLGRPVHPNDHVNASQSSNDVIPTALRVATARGLRDDVLPAIAELRAAIEERAAAFADVVTAGRTHLMDAAPLFVGDAVGAWSHQLEAAESPLRAAVEHLSAVPLGGSAVGTGLNVGAGWAEEVLVELSREVGLPLRPSQDRFAAMAGGEAYAEASAALRTVAVALTKIANDLRWLGSGPFAGLGELRLPELQPGSSIMPGKVNPVLPEVAVQVAARVIGNDVTVGIAAASGNFQLNTFLPLVSLVLDESIRLLASTSRELARRCVSGLEVDAERCRRLAESSPALVTGLARTIGYERAAHLVQAALRDGRALRDVLLDDGISAADVDLALDPVRSARGFLPPGG